MDWDEAPRICRDWAASKREITRLILFGSRVKGVHRPDSDLDIMPVTHAGDFIPNKAQWTDELTELLGVTVHLVEYQAGNRSLVAGVKSEGVIAYSRFGDERDFDVEEHDEIDLDED
jgi:predicted nucleotidyltransferase